MVLCFGSFATILKLCSLPGTTNQMIVSTLVATIDPNNRYQEKNNDTAISRLMNCSRGFPVIKVDPSLGAVRTVDGPQTDIIALAKETTADELADCFNPVIELLDEDKKITAVEALQHLIRNDDSLVENHQTLFVKCLGLTAVHVASLREVDLSTFLAGIFLYTVLTNENSDGKTTLTQIKESGFLNSFSGTSVNLIKSDSIQSTSECIPGVFTYLRKLSDKYNNLPTILHKEAFTPFRDYYVPNNVEWHERVSGKNYSYTVRRLENVTLQKLISISHFLVLSGTGGLGKSMMMRNLLLTAVEEYDELHLIPLFVPLKDYDSSYPDLLSYVYESVTNLWPGLTRAYMESVLESGNALLLFDGLDEIPMHSLSAFTKHLNAFMDRYSSCIYIVSSRPYSNFQSFNRYTVLFLQPFSKKQALTLVDRFNYWSDVPKMQSRFRLLLDTKLYYSHKNFTGNPLLLSIMLLTFEMDADVPTSKHIFYQEAYTVLSKRHDATKDGYHRNLKTGWSANDFAKYFSYFCAVSYSKGKISFSGSDLESYFRSMDDKYHLAPATADDFIFDATNNLCLMYQDGISYGFVHRSFQEYFCARFFHNQLDSDLVRIIPIFDRRNMNKKSDSTLSMLFDMKPQAVEKYMILPYLRDFVRDCEEHSGLWTFLERIYPEYEAADGDAVADDDASAPSSNLYAFILEHYNIPLMNVLTENFDDIDTIQEDYMVYREDTEESDWKENLPWDYEYEYGEPEVVGRLYRFDWGKIRTSPEKAKLKASLEQGDSPFQKEYCTIIELLHTLEAKNTEQPFNDNIFENMF